MKLGMGIMGKIAINIEEYLDTVAALGFESVFADQSSALDRTRLARWRKGCDERGIELENAHSSLSTVHYYRIWLDGVAGEDVLDSLMLSIDNIAAYGIPILVCHIDVRSIEENNLDIGIARFGKLVEYARKKNVKIAFENINNAEFLFKVLDTLTQDNVGFCYDSGHHLCATPEADYSSLYPRLLCCHMHDNHGGKNERMETDQHYLPFEGLVDFPLRLKQMKDAGYKGNLTIETGYENRRDRSLTEDEFLRKTYESAVRLREVYENC